MLTRVLRLSQVVQQHGGRGVSAYVINGYHGYANALFSVMAGWIAEMLFIAYIIYFIYLFYLFIINFTKGRVPQKAR